MTPSVPLSRTERIASGCLTWVVRQQRTSQKTTNPAKQMQTQTIAGVGGLLFVFVYIVCIIAVIVYVLRLLGRFVSAHEKMALSLDIIARKMKDEA